MVVRTFLDEAGIDGKKPFTVVAGYRGCDANWTGFAEAWSAVLATKRDVVEFSSRLFFAGKYPFNQWSREQQATFLDSLIEVVTTHEIIPFGVAVSNAVFNSYSIGERRF